MHPWLEVKCKAIASKSGTCFAALCTFLLLAKVRLVDGEDGTAVAQWLRFDPSWCQWIFY